MTIEGIQNKPVILYVDDEQNCLTSFEASFRRHYMVLISSSIASARELLRLHDIDLLIVDQSMPEMKGIDFLCSLDEEYAHIIKIVLTGFPDLDTIVKTINSGVVVRYMTKPWNEHELRQTIDEVLTIRSQERENQALFSHLQDEIIKKKALIAALQKFIPEKVIQDLISGNQHPTLGGQVKRVTILYSDICSFQSLVTSHSSEEIVEFLNHYFSCMGSCVTSNNGVVDKFLGDGLLALFGVFDTQPGEMEALKCAFDMLAALKKFNSQHGAKLGFETKIGIGIHTGLAMLGHVGSEGRSSYTAIGPAVDSAIEVKRVTRGTANTILISQACYEAVKDRVQADQWEVPVNPKYKDELSKFYQVSIEILSSIQR
jgi:adenylate cyclase